MSIRDLTVAAAIAAALGVSGGAVAQTAPPAPAPGAQQVNPSPMPPGSRANQAPGMGGGQGAGAQQVNPTPMPPGTRAGSAPGMNPGGPAIAQNPREGLATGLGEPGGTGIRAPDAQPDVVPGTLRPGSAVPPPAGQAAVPPPPPTTGATTPGIATEGGGRLTPGANSFTEGQARERISDAGFNDVQGLRLDEQGIWRGRAIRNGQQTGVALDYQGNVAATQ